MNLTNHTFHDVELKLPRISVLSRISKGVNYEKFIQSQRTITKRDRRIKNQNRQSGKSEIESRHARETVNTMGLQTVFSLINYQLKGEVIYKIENGLKWNIKFKDNLHSERV